MLKYEFFDSLPDEAKQIRKTVFVEEQGFDVFAEFDDLDDKSLHLVVFDENKAVGTARLIMLDGNTAKLGRIAVLKEWRKKSVGSFVMDALRSKALELGAMKLALNAQMTAVGFYKKNGFETLGESFLEEGCPHIKMIYSLT